MYLHHPFNRSKEKIVEWNRPLKIVGKRLVKFFLAVSALAVAGWVWNYISLLIWHTMGSSTDCNSDDYGSWYYRCISDDQFLNIFGWQAWHRDGFIARITAMIALAVSVIVLVIIYDKLVKPFIDEFRGRYEEAAPGPNNSSTCQDQFCKCISHHTGNTPWPDDFWDPSKGFWVLSDSFCVDGSCQCTYYHEGQVFDQVARLWVRADN